MFDEAKLTLKRVRLAAIEKELTALRAASRKITDKEKQLHAEADKIRKEIKEELDLKERAAAAKADLDKYRAARRRKR